ncbi:DEKNAAC101586 [Brettanomyces naardenensis]|uniref:Ras-related protein SEC4 n=1 Tax=Brettanomyces naardenensis TaxID=13370 RepID=A0A448YIJ2_BRENA|nr:DEKNAAC101586 [Brettanomyces naardenensis]
MSANRAKTFDRTMKLLLVGDSGVGKSCLLLRFVDDKFNPSFITTIGIDFKIKTIDINGKRIKLQVWDTAGQERFRTITTAYYRGSMGIIIVYDVCDENSFESVKKWYQTVNQHAKDDAQLFLVGNKSDDEESRQVSTKQGELLAQELGIPFMEASAKSGLNVSEVFFKLVNLILERTPEEEAGEEQQGKLDVRQGSGSLSSGSGCC